MVRRLVRRVGRHNGLAAGQIDVDPTGVLLGGILQAEFLADLFDARLDLLDMAGGMVTLADDPGVGVRRSRSHGQSAVGVLGNVPTYTCK